MVALAHQNECTSYYVACSMQDNREIRCIHFHETIPQAVACIQTSDGSVTAFTNGRERPLTVREHQAVVRALLAMVHDERALARRDDLTGELNNRAFRQALEEASARSRRYLTPLTVAYLDLDGFKQVNDLLLHKTGDQVLKVVASTIKSTLREVDHVARLHGDEFAVLLSETGAKNARAVMDRLQKVLKDAMNTNQWKVTFSIGVVTFRTPPAMSDYMINEADKVMSSVKKSGKNRVSYVVRD